MTRRQAALLAGAVLLTALNLRMAIASIPPVVDEIRDDLRLSGVAAGALTTLPVICMSVGAPGAPAVARRLGHEAALLAVVLLVSAGILLRLVPGVGPLYVGTAVAGLAIAMGNVLVPAVVKRDFPHRTGAMTGAFTMAISASGALAAALTVPAADAIGRGWRAGVAIWAAPAFLTAVVWVPALRDARAIRGAEPEPRPAPARLWRQRLAWQVSAFMGLQSLTFYSELSWLPSLLHSHGASTTSAGLLLSVMTLVGMPACLLTPIVAVRRPDQRGLMALTVATAAVGLAGLLLAPTTATVLWIVIAGWAQGASLALALLFFVLRAPDERHAAALSSMAQTVGYLIAAIGPLVVGVLHSATGGWTVPLLFLLALLVPELLVGLGAARPRRVGCVDVDSSRSATGSAG